MVLLGLALAGCRGGGDDGDPNADATTTSEASPQGGGTGSTAATSTTQRAPARVIATSEGEFTGMVLELLGLRRTGGEVVTMDFALRYAGASRSNLNSDSFDDPDIQEFRTVSGAYLTDEVNRKRYLVLRDTAGSCLCSRDIETLFEPGDRRVYFAKFPAPPVEVRTITVVVPHFSPIDGVGISE